ncbi:MAG: hypothetical protein HY287_11270 [Planctomycetes bacterium]|nr:hypothetical protein [Planctomycetota bacterium]MBI3834899.1 hypothetical protein [Planctomycetota bacterium]
MKLKCLQSSGLLVAIVLTAGCTGAGLKYPTATDLQMDKMYATRNKEPEYLDSMVDNASLQDMAIEDFHFVGHSTELSGTGAMYLSRMSPMLSTYGGTVNYDTTLTDEKLIGERIKHAKEYLAMTGCDMSRVDVKAGLEQGTGMPATKAIMIDTKGTGKSDKDNTGPSSVTVSSNREK